MQVCLIHCRKVVAWAGMIAVIAGSTLFSTAQPAMSAGGGCSGVWTTEIDVDGGLFTVTVKIGRPRRDPENPDEEGPRVGDCLITVSPSFPSSLGWPSKFVGVGKFYSYGDGTSRFEFEQRFGGVDYKPNGIRVRVAQDGEFTGIGYLTIRSEGPSAKIAEKSGAAMWERQ